MMAEGVERRGHDSGEGKKIDFKTAGIAPAIGRIAGETQRSVFDQLASSTTGAISADSVAGGRENLTGLDLFFVPENADVLDFVKKQIEVNDIGPEVLQLLSKCFRMAKEYLQEYLGISLPRELQRLSDFKNADDIQDFFRHTQVSTKQKGGFALMYCALAKITLAYWVYEKGNFKNLNDRTGFLMSALKIPEDQKVIKFHDRQNFNRFHVYKSYDNTAPKGLQGKDATEIIIGEDKNEKLDALISYRGKDHYRVINKMIAKEEYALGDSQKDGVGIRFEVDTIEEGVELVCFLKEYIFGKDTSNEDQTQNPREDLVIRDNNFTSQLSEEEKKDADDYFKILGLKHKEKQNVATAINYQSLSLSGRLPLPFRPSQANSQVIPTPVEFQVVLKNNQNENGYSSHQVYEAKQKLSAFSRLFGVFSEEYLDHVCGEVAQKTEGSFVAAKVKEHFILEGFVTKVKVRGENRAKTKYYYTEHLERLKRTGVLSDVVSKRED